MDNWHYSVIIKHLEEGEDTQDFAEAVKELLEKWNDNRVTLRIPHFYEVVVVGAYKTKPKEKQPDNTGIIPFPFMYRSWSAAERICNLLTANGTLCKVMPRVRKVRKTPPVYLN